MSPRRIVALTIAAAATATAAVLWWPAGPAPGEGSAPSPPVAASAQAPAPPPALAATPVDESARASAGDASVAATPAPPATAAASPADLAHLLGDADDVRDRMRRMVEAPESMSAEERAREAAALGREVDRLEASGRVLPAQALLLRTLLLRATATDDETFRRQARALADANQAQLAPRRAEAERALREQGAEYQARAAAIWAEIKASDAYPDEASRKRALRERLHALRVEVYQR
ncbi:MAG: hypothetical protein H6983_13240 [Ectothiorhodospiraceae bacterium]|nr:hypothetical protein [Ectothiorhodospiraceae bacterium]